MSALPPPLPEEIVAHLLAEHDQVPVGLLDADPEYAAMVHDCLHPDLEHEHSGRYSLANAR